MLKDFDARKYADEFTQYRFHCSPFLFIVDDNFIENIDDANDQDDNKR